MSKLTASGNRRMETESEDQTEDDKDKTPADQPKDEAAEGADEDETAAAPDDDEETAEDEEDEKTASFQRGKKAGRAAEKKRISGIVNCKAAKGRESTALALALDTNVSANGATAVLGKAPKDAGSNSLASVMGSFQNANVGADGGDDGSAVQSTAARMAKRFPK